MTLWSRGQKWPPCTTSNNIAITIFISTIKRLMIKNGPFSSSGNFGYPSLPGRNLCSLRTHMCLNEVWLWMFEKPPQIKCSNNSRLRYIVNFWCIVVICHVAWKLIKRAQIAFLRLCLYVSTSKSSSAC